ncbi:MAG: hypothetical protein ACU0CO_18460 [Shimia sp.]
MMVEEKARELWAQGPQNAHPWDELVKIEACAELVESYRSRARFALYVEALGRPALRLVSP